MNTITCVGRTTRDIELRHSKADKAYAFGTIATDVFVSGEKESLFLNFIAFGKTAEYLAKAKKGARVILSGNLLPNQYEKKDGTMVESVKLSVREAEIVFGKQGFKDQADGGGDETDDSIFDDQDIPF